MDKSTDNERPNNPKLVLKNKINPNSETILIIPENPTNLDSLDCNSEYKITLIVRGINEITSNCKLSIPSTYCGKNIEMI